MLKTKDIAFICDDNYCMPTAVCVKSIIDNIVDDVDIITIHVCTFGLTRENVYLLQRLSTNRVKVVVDIFDTAQYKDRINSINQKSHVTPTALIKFEIANYFSYLDSMLYMDSDMIVKRDISELLSLDYNDSYIAASYEFWDHINKISYSLFRSVSKSFYFNSGVMLLNLKKMRDDNISDKLWYYKLNMAKTTLMDQESLNAICAETACHLPIKWNFNPLFKKQSYIKEINRVYCTNYKTLTELEEDVCIIHYVGSTDKPWKYKHANMRHYWDVYYNSLYPNYNLQLIEPSSTKRSSLEAIKDKIHQHGFYGFICNILYLLSERFNNERNN